MLRHYACSDCGTEREDNGAGVLLCASCERGSMLENLSKTFLRKAVYGALGNIALAITWTLANYHPVGDPIQTWVWNSIIVGAGSGLAAAIGRAISWNPAKL